MLGAIDARNEIDIELRTLDGTLVKAVLVVRLAWTARAHPVIVPSGIQLDRRPPGAGAIVARAIVQPSGLADPELDHVGHQTIAGPERRPRHSTAVVLRDELRHSNR